MPRHFCFVTIVFLIPICTVLKGQNLQQNCHILQLYSGWVVNAGEGFSCTGGYHIDSYNGTISSRKDGIRLSFTIGGFPSFSNNKSDCSLTVRTEMFNNILTHHMLDKLYDVPIINKMYLDTVNERIAIIVEPKTVGNGKTAVHLIDCASSSSLLITGSNLNRAQHELVLKMFQTINFIKRD